MFGKVPPSGSLMAAIATPFLSMLCEKSPLRSSSVGKVGVAAVLGFQLAWNSWLQKKNSLFFWVLKTFGMYSGPPMV